MLPRVIAALSLLLCGCVSPPPLPGLEAWVDPPSAWDGEVRAAFPAGPVLVQSVNEDGESRFGTGVLLRRLTGDYVVLTNEHVAMRLPIARESRVHVPAPGEGSYRTFEVQNLIPTADELRSTVLAYEADESGVRALQHLRWLLEGDVALLVLPSAPAGLPHAELGLRGDPVGELEIVSLYPDRAPWPARLYDDPRETIYPRVDWPQEKGCSGSGVYDEEGKVWALAAWASRVRPAPRSEPFEAPDEAALFEELRRCASLAEAGRVDEAVAGYRAAFRKLTRRPRRSARCGVVPPATLLAWLRSRGVEDLLQ